MKSQHIIILTVLFFTILSGFAQESYNLPPKTYYTKAFLGMPDRPAKKIRKVHFGNDSLHFKFNHVQLTLGYNEIDYVMVPEKSGALGGFLIGASISSLISILTVRSVKKDPNLYIKPGAETRITAFIVGTSLIGGLIGYQVKTYKTYKMRE